MPTRRLLFAALFVVLGLYLGGYGAYRRWGPVETHYPRGGGAPALLISVESPTREALYQFFRPCVTVEDWWYRIAHRESPGE